MEGVWSEERGKDGGRVDGAVREGWWREML